MTEVTTSDPVTFTHSQLK